jgi:hypothetical protein
MHKEAERVEPITLILAALAAGASSGILDSLKDSAKEAATAAYQRVHDLVRRRFRGNASAEVMLAEHQADPETYAGPLAKKLSQAGAADDTELVAAATALMELIDQTAAKAGKYNVTMNNVQGAQVGDGNTQVNHF